MDELKYWYSLSKRTYGYSLSARNDVLSLVLTLLDSHKGSDKDAIVVTSDIKPNSTNKLVPQRASGLGLYTSYHLTFHFYLPDRKCLTPTFILCAGAFKVFAWPPLFTIKVKQINALAYHDGGSTLHTQLTHPRDAHILLGYTTTITSFPKRGKNKADKDSKVQFSRGWIGPEPSFEEKNKLFAKYKIISQVHNKWKVYYENKDKKCGPPTWRKLWAPRLLRTSGERLRYSLVWAQPSGEELHQHLGETRDHLCQKVVPTYHKIHWQKG